MLFLGPFNFTSSTGGSPVTRALRDNLNWWKREENLRSGLSLELKDPDHILVMDVSLIGWGAHMRKEGETRDQWREVEMNSHINILNVIYNALQHFENVLGPGEVIQVQCDNIIVVTYVNKQGRTKSTSLCYLTWNLLNWCRD